MARPDPYAVIADLVANALAAARVLGESLRIVHLVAGSVKRFAAEADPVSGAAPGQALVRHALQLIGPEAASTVPRLYAALQAQADA